MKEDNKKHAMNMGIAAAAWYAGANALVPGLGMLSIHLLARKFKTMPRDSNYLNLIAVAGGYAIWALVGGLVARETGALVDAGLSIGLMLWLWFRPGLWPVVFMILYASASLIANTVDFTAAKIGSQVHQALFTHILIRTAEVCLVVWAYWLQVKRERAEEAVLIAYYTND